MTHHLRHAPAFLLALIGILSVAFSPAFAAQSPNLVFVMSDQHSWDMLGCYGNGDIHTPNLDKLASQSVMFNHCIASSPVCTPFRSILLSGQHPLRNGAFQNDLQMLPGKGNYFAEVLRDTGYRTGYYGKWHLYGGERVRGIPPGSYRYGFDDDFLVNNCTLVYDAARAWYWSQDGQSKLLYGDWEPYAQTRQALEFIDRHGDKPFALFLSWHPPHNWGKAHEGYDAPKDLLALYDPAKIKLRPTVKETPQIRTAYQGHMAMITGIDRAFGWLMQRLEDRSLASNTIVVFTSDHGDMLRSYDWPNNKGRAEHTSSRTPLLIRWPAKLQPGGNESLVSTFELMPTLLGLMKLPVPATCEGRDISAAITQQRNAGTDAVPLFFVPLNWRGVYTPRYTYSTSFHDPSEPDIPGKRKTFNVLYDRETDPWETRNLYDDPKFADVKARLHAQTLAQMKRFGDAGLDCNDILRASVRDEDLANVMTAPGKRPANWEGRLKGRPVDFLKSAKPNGKNPKSDGDVAPKPN